ncbi:MAG: hypothetical protein HN396_12340 [Gemmatimonadales bacterium]|jgi:hypothetical protein|nr:hypothetical protein [Gemmatimonadales bacterium]MDG2241789.1 hypothetical protein [Longimicrobiales bacterium]MBT3957543.1 hypothetical protein [Gemmatimonadales bacterium]MBT4186410.1 hypothetical protein [Gemmatimonadales bacterium]MBT5044782.1 hypothetical protein [Gemmatimonadales bacterium]
MDETEENRVGAWEELRRRRVGRVSSAYITIAFALVEVAKWVVGTGGESDTLHRILLGAAVLGLPLAVVLSFFYDVTPTGVVRTPEDATADPVYETGSRVGWGLLLAATVAIGLLARVLRM